MASTYELISSTTATSGSVLSINVPSTYDDLVIYAYNILSSTAGVGVYMRFNNDSNTGRYCTTYQTAFASTVARTGTLGTKIDATNYVYANDTSYVSTMIVNIQDYNSTTYFKPYFITSQFYDGASSQETNQACGNFIMQNSPISSIQFGVNSGSFNSITVDIFGIKAA